MPKFSTFLFAHADKFLLLGVPYLACASILYYAGYWGLLGVDVYSYFAVSDLIKGAAYPIQVALATAAVTAALDFLLMYGILMLFKTRSVWWPALALVSVHVLFGLFVWHVGVFVYGLLRYGTPMGWFTRVVPLLHAPLYAVLLICVVITWVTKQLLAGNAPMPTDKKTLKQLTALAGTLKRADLTFPPRSKRALLRMLTVLKRLPQAMLTAHLQRTALGFALLAIPAFSFTAGYCQAMDVLAGLRYEYVEPQVFRQDTLLAAYPYLKYLGRAGDYLFLLTPDNQRRIVIGKDHWPALLLRLAEPPKAGVGPPQ